MIYYFPIEERLHEEMNYIKGRYGFYQVSRKIDPVELQKRLRWLKEMEKRYYYIERFAKEESCVRDSRACDYWAFGTSPF